jgi:hypothetical protein
MQNTRYSRQILMKLEFSLEFRKILEHQISFKSVLLEQSCSNRTEGQRDTHDEAFRFSSRCECA